MADSETEEKFYGALTMEMTNERRREQRLRYHWPVWFAEDFNNALTQGQMVDVSSGGAAFTCYVNENCPSPGQEIVTRFSVPRFGEDDSFDMASFIRNGRVCRIDHLNNYLRKVAIQFVQPLPFKPGEQAESEADQQQKMMAVAI